jgi:hypothetical protein
MENNVACCMKQNNLVWTKIRYRDRLARVQRTVTEATRVVFYIAKNEHYLKRILKKT